MHEEVYNSQEAGGVTIVYSQEEEDSDSDSEDGTTVYSQHFLQTPQMQRDSLLQKEDSDSEEGSTVYSLQQQNLQEEATTVQEEATTVQEQS